MSTERVQEGATARNNYDSNLNTYSSCKAVITLCTVSHISLAYKS